MTLPIVDYATLGETDRRAALARPAAQGRDELLALVRETLARVRSDGDAALIDYAARFDGGAPVNLKVPTEEIDAAMTAVGPQAIAALSRAIANVRRFHEAQRQPDLSIETSPGVRCERVFRPIDAVGLYVPGGSAPLPSALIMSAVPAAIAGCPTRIVCSPGTQAGRVDPVILATARLCGITDVFAIGGAQAIAAMAYGTATIPKVNKIFGPGSAWVTAAKQLVANDPEGAALDLPAGPSEVLVIADEHADPAFVAADLLAQAEHDPLSQAILLTPSRALAEAVRARALEFREQLTRRSILDQSLARSRVIVVADVDQAIDISNAYAPEHLILQIRDARGVLERIRAAGSIFLGAWSPEPLGDYCSGTNHVLPTYGYARAYSGLSLADFQRRITVQELTPAGLRDLGPTASALARLEGLDAHALAVDLRLTALSRTPPASDRTSTTSAVLALARPAIARMRPYEHASWNPRFERLHANECPWPPPLDGEGERLALHRYPEPQPRPLIEALARTYDVSEACVLVGRGSDEGIDLLTRAFCEAERDAVIVCPPTFGMYAVAAASQGAAVISVPLTREFQLDVPAIESAIDRGAKILWLCSPNNPTGNSLDPFAIERLLRHADGRCLVVVDEAYAEFTDTPSWTRRLAEFPHLVVLRTLSKAYGLAGARIGTVIAAAPVISLLRKIIPPYAIPNGSIDAAVRVLAPANATIARARIGELRRERVRLADALRGSPWIKAVYPSDANFLLVEAQDAAGLLARIESLGLVVRNFSGKPMLGQAVRITVGTPEQNRRLIDALQSQTPRSAVS